MDVAKLGSDHYFLFWCPGCDSAHGIPVDGSRGWQWNGSLSSPTITPSILVSSTDVIVDGERILGHKYRGPYPEDLERVVGICHSYITDGRIQFLNDCTHPLSGQVIPLEDW
jgi:hypothetical protein